MVDVRLIPIEENVLAVEASYPSHDTDVRALLVHGDRFSLLVDTFARPADLGIVREEIARRGRPLLIVNSHADWDHWWGNEAFPDAPVIASRATAVRQHREGARVLRQMASKEPDLFGDMKLRAATVLYDGGGRLAGSSPSIDLGGITAELHSLPGHTHDQIVVWFSELQILFAADAAEDPIPLVTEGPIAGWPEMLESWATRARIVAPAHGAISGPELLGRNAAYLRGLIDTPERDVPELAGVTAFYHRAHRRNLKRGATEAFST